jgi:hypothetical protein
VSAPERAKKVASRKEDGLRFPAVGAELLRAVLNGEDSEDAEAGLLLLAEAVGTLIVIGRALVGTKTNG